MNYNKWIERRFSDIRGSLTNAHNFKCRGSKATGAKQDDVYLETGKEQVDTFCTGIVVMYISDGGCDHAASAKIIMAWNKQN